MHFHTHSRGTRRVLLYHLHILVGICKWLPVCNSHKFVWNGLFQGDGTYRKLFHPRLLPRLDGGNCCAELWHMFVCAPAQCVWWMLLVVGAVFVEAGSVVFFPASLWRVSVLTVSLIFYFLTPSCSKVSNLSAKVVMSPLTPETSCFIWATSNCTVPSCFFYYLANVLSGACILLGYVWSGCWWLRWRLDCAWFLDELVSLVRVLGIGLWALWNRIKRRGNNKFFFLYFKKYMCASMYLRWLLGSIFFSYYFW